jgi:hypothetical protein
VTDCNCGGAAAEGPVALEPLGERPSGLRLHEPAALEGIRVSLSRHGHLSVVVAFDDGGQLQLPPKPVARTRPLLPAGDDRHDRDPVPLGQLLRSCRQRRR